MSIQEPEIAPKSLIPAQSDYESDGEEAFPELEVHVSVLLDYPNLLIFINKIMFLI